jgi:hypothetical protein
LKTTKKQKDLTTAPLESNLMRQISSSVHYTLTHVQVNKELEKSAIALSLQRVATMPLTDLEVGYGGDISTPIADALGFKYRRYGRQANESRQALSFVNEDGTIWQAKIFETDRQDGRSGQYLAPVENGDRIYTPAIDSETRQKISDRYSVDVPQDVSFWEWLADHHEIPIIITEGGKKSLSLLSQGYVAIALYGCSSGFNKEDNDLKDNLKPFAQEGRKIAIALDRDPDAKPKAQRDVKTGISRLSWGFSRNGCDVVTVLWDGQDGKGVDDLIVNKGIQAFERAYEQAKPYKLWQLGKHLEKRLARYKPDYGFDVPDLSQAINLETIPKTGIVWLNSGKGTGKTKAIANLVKDSEKVLSLGHRVALQRNLANRLDCDYIADIDKYESEFIADGSRKTRRVSLCADSLLSIPTGFVENGDLVLDEVDQVLRHLQTGSTCGKNGKRPALIAKFIQVVREAKRVILASADIDSWMIDLIASIRNEHLSYGISNNYKANGYDCDFYQSGDDAAIIARLILDVTQGEKLFVSTDSKSKGKRLAKVLYPIIGKEAILEVNSQTSGSQEIKAFIESPDQYLADHPYIKVVIATPSMGTGVSIEGDHFDKVYGLFYGVSICDNDASQALSRVRKPIPRIVWAKRKGSLYSRFGQDFAPFAITANIQKLTKATTHLLKDAIAPEQLARINAIDWQGAIMTATATIETERNRSMADFRDALQVRLEHEGNHITIIESSGDKATRQMLRDASQEVKLDEANAIANAPDLTLSQAQEYEAKQDRLDPSQLASLAKFNLANFYALDRITVDDVLGDRYGRTRTALTRLEHLLYADLATEKDVKSIANLCQWQTDITPVDIPTNTLKQETEKLLHIPELLAYVASGNEWQTDTPIVEKVCKAMRHYANNVKQILGFTVSEKMSNCQLIGEILTRYGLKTESRRSHGDRLYRVDLDSLNKVRAIITRRHQKRLDKGIQLQVTPLYSMLILGGDWEEQKASNIPIPIADPVDDDEFF